MYTLLKPFEVREALLERGLTVFTPYDFERVFAISDHKAKYFLEKEATTGLLLRLKKGLYSLKTDIPSEEEIANRLYRPSYISFEYALSYYHLIPESVYEITSATTKPTRRFDVSGKTFSYLTIKKQAYTGYTVIKKMDTSFVIAEPEKAVVDYCYFVSLGKKSLNNRLNIATLNREKLYTYARLYERARIVSLIQTL